MKTLRAKGFAAYINQVQAGASYVNRVYVGPELDKSKAQALLKQLQQSFGLKGVVVKFSV